MDNQTSRFHAEVKGSLNGREVRVNIFANDLDSLFTDIGIVSAEFALPTLSQPGFEKYAHPTPQAQPTRQAPPPPKPQNPQPTTQSPAVPVCLTCGQSDQMELIDFTDRRTGELRSAWKCQRCNEWHWPNGKPKAKAK